MTERPNDPCLCGHYRAQHRVIKDNVNSVCKDCVNIFNGPTELPHFWPSHEFKIDNLRYVAEYNL